MNRRKSTVVIVIICIAAMTAAAQIGDRIGTPGYIGLAKADGIWYFTAPDGKLFLSKGVNLVQPWDDAVKPGSRGYYGLGGSKSVDAWVVETAALLRSWGFNTMGCWSHFATRNGGLYFTPVLYIRIERNGKMKDVFAAAEGLHAKSAAVTDKATYRDDPPAVHRSFFGAIFPADFSARLRAAGYSDTANGDRGTDRASTLPVKPHTSARRAPTAKPSPPRSSSQADRGRSSAFHSMSWGCGTIGETRTAIIE
jgi:hypothetical protein